MNNSSWDYNKKKFLVIDHIIVYLNLFVVHINSIIKSHQVRYIIHNSIRAFTVSSAVKLNDNLLIVESIC